MSVIHNPDAETVPDSDNSQGCAPGISQEPDGIITGVSFTLVERFPIIVAGRPIDFQRRIQAQLKRCVCGGVFTAIRPNHIYCGAYCKRRAKHLRRMAKKGNS